MILYQALSSYQILECIVHRQVYYREEKCILILGTYITERMPRYRELETKKLFDEVYLFRFGGYRGSGEEILREVGEELRRTLPYDIRSFGKILAAGIHTYLQAYLIDEEIPFEMFEDGSGALSRPWILAELHRKSAPGRYSLIEQYGLYDHRSPLITKKYCDMRSQEPDFEDERAVDFQVLENFRRLPERIQREVRGVFDVPELEGEPDAVLLLTQQFANLGQLSLEGQAGIYRHLFDYYLRGRKVLIKPHPDDILYYGSLFPKAEIIRESFPSELLPLAFRVLPGTVCTVSSTGINLIRREFSEEIVFDAEYERTYRYDALYDMALKLADYAGVKEIRTLGVNLAQLQNLASCRRGRRGSLRIEEWKGAAPAGKKEGDPPEGGAVPPENRVLYVCGDRAEETALREIMESVCIRREENVQGILFLNEEEGYPMYAPGRKNEFLRMIPVAVRKESRKEADAAAWSGMEEEQEEWDHAMYFYSEKGEVRKMVSEFGAEEELCHEGAVISVRKLSDEQIRIRMLEGILAAAERRLLEYIESEKELRRELAELRAGEREGGV